MRSGERDASQYPIIIIIIARACVCVCVTHDVVEVFDGELWEAK